MKTETQTCDTLEADLRQFSGSENFYRQGFGRLLYTNGVKYLADQAVAYWLIDLVASHQRGALLHTHFQVWTLSVDRDNTPMARAECREDSGQPVLKAQNIEYTDFPLASITLWLVDGTLMLPSEY